MTRYSTTHRIVTRSLCSLALVGGLAVGASAAQSAHAASAPSVHRAAPHAHRGMHPLGKGDGTYPATGGMHPLGKGDGTYPATGGIAPSATTAA